MNDVIDIEMIKTILHLKSTKPAVFSTCIRRKFEISTHYFAFSYICRLIYNPEATRSARKGVGLFRGYHLQSQKKFAMPYGINKTDVTLSGGLDREVGLKKQ